MTKHRVCSQIFTTGVTNKAGTAYPSGAPEFSSGFQWGSCYSILSFMSMFCRSLFVFFPLSIVLSVLHRFTNSDYLFGIFKLFLLNRYGMSVSQMITDMFRLSFSLSRTFPFHDILYVSPRAWFTRYIYHCNLQLLNNVIIINIKYLLPQVQVTLAVFFLFVCYFA